MADPSCLVQAPQVRAGLTLPVLELPFLKRLRMICRVAAEVVGEVWWPLRDLGEGGDEGGRPWPHSRCPKCQQALSGRSEGRSNKRKADRLIGRIKNYSLLRRRNA